MTKNYYGISICVAVAALLLVLAGAPAAQAMDEMTVYELLQPSTHQFAIRYDTAADTPGMTEYFNIIRPGSQASDEKVLDRSTGKELPFVLTNGKEAKKAGQADATESDKTGFIKVKLAHAVPQNGEYRLRILKTYRDPKSYYEDHGDIVFDRSLGVKRNMVILPAGYEVIACSVPAMVDTSGGRVRVSMVNDRDDELAVRIVGRKLPATEVTK